MSTSKNIILITGGNAGIGIEIARQMLAYESSHVIITSRSIDKGEAALVQLRDLSLPGSVEMVQMDVTRPDSVNAAAQKVESTHGKLDVLVNNAALAMLPDTSYDQLMLKCYETNVVGPYLTGEAFAPLLLKSTSTPRIVNVSSGGGSIHLRLNPIWGPKMPPFRLVHYDATKAALNMLTADQTMIYGPQGIKVFAVSPGFTVSNLGPFNKAEMGAKPVAKGAEIIVEVVNGGRDDEVGKHLHGHEVVHEKPGNGQYPW